MIEYSNAVIQPVAGDDRPMLVTVNRWPSGITHVRVWGPGGETIAAEIELAALDTSGAAITPDGAPGA